MHRLDGGELVDTKREVALDVSNDVPVAEPIDYCSVPEPGLCCCEPLNLLFTLEADAGPEGCRFVLPGGPQYRPQTPHLEVVSHPGEFLHIVSGPDDCAQGAYYYVESEPVEVVLCPATCEVLRATGRTTLRLRQGCYAIACPPP